MIFLKDIVMGTFTHNDLFWKDLKKSAEQYYPDIPFILQKDNLPIYENRKVLHDRFKETGKRFWLVLDHDVQFVNDTVIPCALETMLRNRWSVCSGWGHSILNEKPEDKNLTEKEMDWLVGFFQLIDSKYVGGIYMPKMPCDNTCEDLAYSLEIKSKGFKMGSCKDYFYHKDAHEKEIIYSLSEEEKNKRYNDFTKNHAFLSNYYGISFYRKAYTQTYTANFNKTI